MPHTILGEYIKAMVGIKWIKARCPICGQLYDYPKSGYNPKTCGKYECAHKFLHPEINKERG